MASPRNEADITHRESPLYCSLVNIGLVNILLLTGNTGKKSPALLRDTITVL